jgi:hypothetical protein
MFDDLTDEPEPRGAARQRLVVGVLALMWFCAALWAVVRTLVDAWDRTAVDFFGGTGIAGAVRERALVTLCVAAGPPVIGLVIALLLHRRRAAAIWPWTPGSPCSPGCASTSS